MVSEILTFFRFSQKFKMAAKMAKIEIFQFCIEYFPTTLWVKNSVQIALSLTVSEIFRFFRFSQKFKMAAKSGENWNFLILYRILFYYPVSQKFCPNRSISYGFWDIKIFSLFAKIQDGRQKWRKLKFFKILYRILFYYPVGQKFCRNCSISYGFRDISIFCFSAKIQDGRQKWRKLKFFNCTYNTLPLRCESKFLWKWLYLLRFPRY